MALLDFDGHDHYSTALMTSSGRWTSRANTNGGSAPVISAGNGRRSTDSLRIVLANNAFTSSSRADRTYAPGDTKCILGFGFKISAAPGAALEIVSVKELGTQQVCVVVNTDLTLSVYRGSAAGTLLGTTSAAISTGTFYHLEFKVVIHNSTGTVDLVINGVTRLTLTGQDTQATGTTAWNSVSYGLSTASHAGDTGVTMDYDDRYVCDGTTQSGPNAFNNLLGDCFVTAVQPTDDGAHADFTPSTGTDHYALVDDNPPNGDTDYNEAASLGDRDSYLYVLPADGDIFAVLVDAYARRTDAGVRKIVDFVHDDSTSPVSDHDGATEQSLGTDYLFFPFIRSADPKTDAAWTSGTHEIGVKVST